MSKSIYISFDKTDPLPCLFLCDSKLTNQIFMIDIKNSKIFNQIKILLKHVLKWIQKAKVLVANCY